MLVLAVGAGVFVAVVATAATVLVPARPTTRTARASAAFGERGIRIHSLMPGVVIVLLHIRPLGEFVSHAV